MNQILEPTEMQLEKSIDEFLKCDQLNLFQSNQKQTDEVSGAYNENRKKANKGKHRNLLNAFMGVNGRTRAKRILKGKNKLIAKNDRMLW